MKRKLDYRSPGAEEPETDEDPGRLKSFIREFGGEMLAHVAGFLIMAVAALLVWLLFRWLRVTGQ
jgi:hypothetical protein